MAAPLLLFLLLLLCGCGESVSSPKSAEATETAQIAGEFFASLDDMATGSGGGYTRTTCGAVALGACSNNVRVLDLSGCTSTNSAAVFSGTVTLTWVDDGVDDTCAMTTAAHSITRVPDVSVTGLYSSTYTYKKSGSYGERLTKGVGVDTYAYSSDGISRKLLSGSVLAYDYTTETTTDIPITGATRATRVASGGVLLVTNNLTGVSCPFVPTDLAWASNCNCPVSGSLIATCSDGKPGKVTIASCGLVSSLRDGISKDFKLDRCYGL